MLPLLVYGLFITSSYVLAAAFITHFVVRAFWVGFIGLISVYKDGVIYEKLPYSDLYKKRMEKELGDSDSLAERLDNISSLIYSIAFSLVLIMVGTAIIYTGVFLLYNVSKLLIDQAVFDTYASVLYYLFIVIAVIYVTAILVLNMERFRSNEKLARWHLKLTFNANKVILPLVYRPLQFIQLTFLSNMTSTRFASYYGVIFVGFFVVFLFISLNLAAPNIFDTRDFFATRSSESHIERHEYSTNLQENDIIQSAALEKEVISSNMMKLFIPYPKQLDEIFNQACTPVQLSDTLSSHETRRLTNEHNIRCADDIFSFSINDTIRLESQLFFTQHSITGQKGFMTMLDVSALEGGAHTVKVIRDAVTSADSTRMEENRMLT